MIVETDKLAELAGVVALVDGGFDPLHSGHIAYIEAAAALGAPVLCNISPDAWVERKHPVLLPQKDRGVVIDALRSVTYTHLSSTSTAAVLELARPRMYVKGADWRGNLPREEVELCEQFGIEIVYLDTILDSSTALVNRWYAQRPVAGRRHKTRAFRRALRRAFYRVTAAVLPPSVRQGISRAIGRGNAEERAAARKLRRQEQAEAKRDMKRAGAERKAQKEALRQSRAK